MAFPFKIQQIAKLGVHIDTQVLQFNFSMNMKKIAVFLLLFCALQATFAQKLTVEEVITGLTEIPTIVKYKEFKKDIEKLVVETTANPNLSAEDYNALRTAYNGTKLKYDAFVGEIKSDLLDFRNVKKMSDKPMEYSEKYMTGFNEAVDYYEKNFVPVYNNIKSKERVIPPQLIQAGIQGFIMLVDFLKKRHTDNQAHKNDILNSINTMFTTPLAMTPWEKLVTTPAPSATIIPPAPAPAPTNGNGGGMVKGGGTPAVTPAPTPATPANTPVENPATPAETKTLTPIQVPYPTIKELNGEIEFLYVSNLQPIRLSNMAFEPKLRKLVVGTVQGGAAAQAETGFTSRMAFPEYTSFQIKVKNTALMYAFAFNPDKTCYDVYPFPEEWIEAYKMSKNRALKVGPLMLKSDDNVVTIPSRNAESGEENYINIEGKASQELFCLLLSKSELNTVELYKKIEEAQGNLEERLKAVLGDEMLTTEEANVKIENGKIFYNADALSKKVLPLVFVIQRK